MTATGVAPRVRLTSAERPRTPRPERDCLPARRQPARRTEAGQRLPRKTLTERAEPPETRGASATSVTGRRTVIRRWRPFGESSLQTLSVSLASSEKELRSWDA